jgi:predicted nucleic acid-binding protein
VVDASAAMPWGFTDEADDAADALLDRVSRDGAVVPAIWPYEIAGVLAVGIRRGRINAQDARDFARFLQSLPIRIEAAPQITEIRPLFELAGRWGVSAYDAAYLQLARRQRFALATRDERLATIARRRGIAVA